MVHLNTGNWMSSQLHCIFWYIIVHYYCSHKSCSCHVICRWMEVIRSATCSSNHIRSFSRKDPHPYWPKIHTHTLTQDVRFSIRFSQHTLTYFLWQRVWVGIVSCVISFHFIEENQPLNGFRCEVLWEQNIEKSPENTTIINIARRRDQQVKVKHFQF